MYLITCNSIACFTSLWTSESISTCTFVFYSRGYPATVPIPKCQILKTKQHTTSQFCLYLLIFITFITHLHKRLVDITEDSGAAQRQAALNVLTQGRALRIAALPPRMSDDLEGFEAFEAEETTMEPVSDVIMADAQLAGWQAVAELYARQPDVDSVLLGFNYHLSQHAIRPSGNGIEVTARNSGFDSWGTNSHHKCGLLHIAIVSPDCSVFNHRMYVFFNPQSMYVCMYIYAAPKWNLSWSTLLWATADPL